MPSSGSLRGLVLKKQCVRRDRGAHHLRRRQLNPVDCTACDRSQRQTVKFRKPTRRGENHRTTFCILAEILQLRTNQQPAEKPGVVRERMAVEDRPCAHAEKSASQSVVTPP